MWTCTWSADHTMRIICLNVIVKPIKRKKIKSFLISENRNHFDFILTLGHQQNEKPSYFIIRAIRSSRVEIGTWTTRNYFKGNRCELRSDCNINFYDIPASWRLLFPRYERKRKKYNYKFSGGLVEDFDLRKHSTSSFLSTGINFARRMSLKITGNRGEIEHNHHFEDYEDCEFF